ncbi:MAG TPA: hypothetical protein VMP67_00100 [Candidatus Limnocylindria bacterium]|nr:hypothetical protein [Candidatus Limnocylindria bacterium]
MSSGQRTAVQRAAVALALVLGVVVIGGWVADGSAGRRAIGGFTPEITIVHFMTGLACVESSGRYTAVNAESGAIGKYQIMPRNWRVWAGRMLGDADAQPTPQNQETVARTRIGNLYDSRGSWRRVAYWWLTGRSITDETQWTSKARGYVNQVMALAVQAATPRLADGVPERCRPQLPELPVVPGTGYAAQP